MDWIVGAVLFICMDVHIYFGWREWGCDVCIFIYLIFDYTRTLYPHSLVDLWAIFFVLDACNQIHVLTWIHFT